MNKSIKLIFLGLLLLWSFTGGREGLSQTSPGEKDLPVQIGSIEFKIREIEATPSPIRMLELQIEIINRSSQTTLPPNAVKIVAVPKTVQFLSAGLVRDFAPLPEEVTLLLPFPPRSSQIAMIGFALPKEKLESISFEIEINPPEGEKKTATFNFSR